MLESKNVADKHIISKLCVLTKASIKGPVLMGMYKKKQRIKMVKNHPQVNQCQF